MRNLLLALLTAAPLGATPALESLDGYKTNPFPAAYQTFQWRAFRELSPFLDRLDWQAVPRRGKADKHVPLMVTIHHTEGRLPVDEAESRAVVQSIQWYHMAGRAKEKLAPFDDVGYHFLIDGAGRVYQGRPLEDVGAHARGGNTANVGIALLGNFRERAPEPAQLQSAVRLIVYLGAMYRLGGEPDFIAMHSDFVKDTDCPGAQLAALVPLIREQVDAETIRLRREAGH